jgi:hypothetical protein
MTPSCVRPRCRAAGTHKDGAALLSFVCEIPRGTREKFEIHKSKPYNPVMQDVHKDGSPRSYTYSPSRVNCVCSTLHPAPPCTSLHLPAPCTTTHVLPKSSHEV